MLGKLLDKQDACHETVFTRMASWIWGCLRSLKPNGQGMEGGWPKIEFGSRSAILLCTTTSFLSTTYTSPPPPIPGSLTCNFCQHVNSCLEWKWYNDEVAQEMGSIDVSINLYALCVSALKCPHLLVWYSKMQTNARLLLDPWVSSEKNSNMTKDFQVKIRQKKIACRNWLIAKVPWCQEEYLEKAMEWGDTWQL
jgi:hypothetical protein